jgi:hypothetical protein
MLCLNNIRVHHIGYAVEDIEKAYSVFSLLDYMKMSMGGGGGGQWYSDRL